jgi:uncharacterized protein YjbI with pentapeptide repeats
MHTFRIADRWSSLPLAQVNASTLGMALEIATARRVSLAGAMLQRTRLNCRFLAMADLRNADLSYADLRNCHLTNADLRGATLCGAYLDGADLQFADLRGADMTDASLNDANLTQSNLLGADLSTAVLGKTDVQKVIWDWRSATVVSALLRKSRLLRLAAPNLLIDLDMCDPHAPFAWSGIILRHTQSWEISLPLLARAVTEIDNMPQTIRTLTANRDTRITECLTQIHS